MLSPQVCYAVKALAQVAAARGRAVSVREIAREAKVPPAYLAKIVRTLSRRGLVATRRGVGGGVSAARATPLASVTIHDLCVAFDDPLVEQRCLVGEATCSDERACPAHAFWAPQRERLRRFLRSTTVDDVARFEARATRRGKDGLP
jgi:Rrf2 family protein